MRLYNKLDHLSQRGDMYKNICIEHSRTRILEGDNVCRVRNSLHAYILSS